MRDWESRVLFIDGEALVIDKPAGLAVHPGPRTPRSLEDHLHALRFGFKRPPRPVHRLDRDTSGCLLLARNPKSNKLLQQAFEANAVEKTYVAILAGIPAAASGTVDLALAKRSTAEQGWRMVPDAGGQPALTHWRVAAARGGLALVLFRPQTGRTHQLRVHAVEGIGVPIAGDPVYGTRDGPMLLHALGLRVVRGNKPPIDAVAPLPETFLAAGFDAADLEAGDGH